MSILCSPRLWPSILISMFYLKTPNFRLLWCRLLLFLPGVGGWEGGRWRVLLHLCLLLDPLLGKQSTMQTFSVYSNTEQKARTKTPCSQPASLLLCLGTLLHSGTTHSSYDLGSWNHPVTWNFTLLHHLNTFKPGTFLPKTLYQTSKSSDFALHCLKYFAVTALSRLPPLHHIFSNITPGSILPTSSLPNF